MIILLNKQLIMNEMLEWSRYRLAEIIRIPISAVVVGWELDGDQVHPKMSINREIATGVTDAELKEVCKWVAREMHGMLRERLAGLDQRRLPPADISSI